MTKLIVNVEEEKLEFFIQLMNNLDFVQFEKLKPYDLSEAQINILNERLANYKANPNSSKDWDTIRKELGDEFDL